MNKKLNILLIVLFAIIGVAAGSLANNDETKAINGCDGTTCEHVIIQPEFRCFSGVDDGYTCDDSGPGCSETLCSN